MTPFRSAHLPLALLLASATLLSACGRDSATPQGRSGESAATSDTADDGFIARTARKAMEAARKDLADGNISVGGTGSSSGVKVNGFRFGG